MSVKPWVKELCEGVFPPNHLSVGKRLKRPDGTLVEITKGQYWSEYGISNFWHWREVMPDGSLSEHEECGYGWRTES